jgi:hypothetical protein
MGEFIGGSYWCEKCRMEHNGPNECIVGDPEVLSAGACQHTADKIKRIAKPENTIKTHDTIWAVLMSAAEDEAIDMSSSKASRIAMRIAEKLENAIGSEG